MPVLALALACLTLLLACHPAEPAPPRPDILLITLDTLRADHLGAYGASAGATPQLDALAARGVVFERALAASSRTAPSHASIFTSRWVSDHAIGPLNGSTRLGDEPTLAALLGDAGYETAAFVSNSMLQRRVGLDAGFATYDDALPDSETNRAIFERIAEKTTARAGAWLRRPRSAPRFLWVHYNDAHGPYTPPRQFVAPPAGASKGEPPLPLLDQQRGIDGIPAYQGFGDEREPRQYRARYEGEIRYVDASVGRLLEAFEESVGAAGEVIAVTADHGESLGEEGMWFSHGFGTTPNLAQVPFLLATRGLPSGDLPAARVTVPVHHVDVMPTLLGLAGLATPPKAEGIALGPVVLGKATLPPDRLLYVDVGAEVSVYRGDTFLRARLSGEDLPEAPTGSRRTWRWHDASSWEPTDASQELLDRVLRYDRGRVSLRPAVEPSAEEKARMRSLGYLEPEEPVAD